MGERAEEVAQQICADLFPDGWGPLSEELIVPILRAYAEEVLGKQAIEMSIAHNRHCDLAVEEARREERERMLTGESPVWLVWVLLESGPPCLLRAVDLSLSTALRHREALLSDPRFVRAVVEESRANHLYAGAFAVPIRAREEKR